MCSCFYCNEDHTHPQYSQFVWHKVGFACHVFAVRMPHSLCKSLHLHKGEVIVTPCNPSSCGISWGYTFSKYGGWCLKLFSFLLVSEDCQCMCCSMQCSDAPYLKWNGEGTVHNTWADDALGPINIPQWPRRYSSAKVGTNASTTTISYPHATTFYGCILSGTNGAMQPRCAMRFESQTPKSLAMRKKYFLLAMRKHVRLIDLKKKKNQRKSCDVGLGCKKSGWFLRSSDPKCLRFGLPLRFGLRCERPRCQIASDVGRAMRTTKDRAYQKRPRPSSRA